MEALASLLLDRFVSASSAEDAYMGLERILEALKANTKKKPTSEDEKEETKLPPEMIWSDPEILDALRHVLHTGNHKHNDMEVPVEEGASLVCRIYMEMVDQESTKSPLLEKDETLLECLIDVISSGSDNNDNGNDDNTEAVVPMYTRVLALQLLTKLCVKRPSKAQAQLLQAPNGLYRLGDLLNVHQEEIIRNEALLLAQVIAEWASCAKIWMFSEVADQVILLALEEGGLTKGNLLVQDCLDLLFKLWKHDPNLADLVFQSPTIASNLPRLLDLRQGSEFLNPPSKKIPVAKKDDDLDDILKSASSKEPESKEDEVIVPKLTPAEEKVIEKTLDILALLLESDSLKQSVWARQGPLCSLMWELALVSPPPPQVPFVCAVPSPQLQQKALETTALYFHDPVTMERHAGLDRLLYLVCTGGLGTDLKEKMGISQAALHAIRKTVTAESANQMLMYTLAPPMTMDDENEDGPPQPPPPTVVHKLLNTVAENLTMTPGIDPERRKIFLAGALGGLSIFLTDQTTREVMLRLTTSRTKSGEPVTEEDIGDDPDGNTDITTTSLVESILHAVGSMEEADKPEDAFLSMTLLRFLCHWTLETPAVVQTILSSNQSSLVLSALLSVKTKTNSHKKGVAVLGKLLLGLSMEFMGEDEGKCGGWTRSSIMELIAKKSGGVSKFTSSLEQFKSVKDFGDTMPWSVCKLEYKVWAKWFSNCVLLVRKRMVQELTGSGESEEAEDEGSELVEGETPSNAAAGKNARSLQKLVFQQSQEIDELQQSLDTANNKIVSQHHELSEYKRRLESAPSQLDTMLNEYLAKISALETKATEMKEEKRVQEEKHKSEIASRDDHIANLQKELEESHAREKESRDETESLREEIQSLSQAYNSLEQEYRVQQQRQESPGTAAATMTSSEQQPGEQEEEGSHQHRNQQQQHSSTAGVGSTEISALRAENERLRTDAQAADEWMAMAVQNMNTMGQQNAMLQTELSNLRNNQSQDVNEQHRILQEQNQSLFDEKQSLVQQLGHLQSSLDNAARENQHLQDAIQQEKEQYVALERQFSDGNNEFVSAKSELEHRIKELTLNLESASIEIDNLKQQQQQKVEQQSGEDGHNNLAVGQEAAARYEADIKAKNEEIGHLQGELERQSADFEAEKQNLASEFEGLKGSVESARVELESSRRHDQEEIYKRESRIRELEARINNNSSGHGGLSDADIKEKDDEIAELRAANEAAHDWMQKAVSHHNMLSEQHAKLSSENSALLSQVRELKEKVGQNEALVANAHVREQESAMLSTRLSESEASLESSEVEIRRLQEEVASLKSKADDLLKTSNEVTSLQTSIEEQRSLCDQLRSEVVAETDAKNAVMEELKLLKSKLSEGNDTNAAMDSLRQQIGQLEASLTDSKASCEKLQNELAAEREATAASLAEIQSLNLENERIKNSVQSERNAESEAPAEDNQQLSELFVQLQKARDENSELIRSQKDDEVVIRGLNEVIESLRATNTTTTTTAVQPQVVSQGTNAQDFFSAGDAAGAGSVPGTFGASSISSGAASAEALFGGATAPAPSAGNAQDLFGAPPTQSSGGAQDFFGASSPAAANAEEFFGTAPAPVPREEDAQQFFTAATSVTAGQSTSDEAGRSGAQQTEVEELLRSQLADKMQQIERLEGQLSEANNDFADVRQSIAANLEISKQRISELETSVDDLQKQLKQRDDDLRRETESTADAQHSSDGPKPTKSDDELQSELERTKALLAEAEAKIKEDEDVVMKWEERVAALETEVKELDLQLTEQEDSANAAITQWQESFTALEEKNMELMQALESSGGSSEGNPISGHESSHESIAALNTDLETTKTALAEAEAKLAEDDQVVVKWEERVAELESAVKDLEVQLSEQEENANSAILKWQESCNSLEEKNSQLVSSLESFGGGDESDALASLQAQLHEAHKALTDARENMKDDDNAVLHWQERVATLEAALEDSEEQLKAQEAEVQGVIAQWQERYTELEEQNTKLEASLKDSNELVEAQKVEAQTVVAQWQERYTEAEEQSIKLEGALKDSKELVEAQKVEAQSVVAQWQGRYTELEEQNIQLEGAVKESNERLEAEKVEARGLVTKVEASLQELNERVEAQKAEAQGVIAQWQERYAELEEQNAELRGKLETLSKAETDRGMDLNRLQEQLDAALEELTIANQKLKNDEDVILKWQEQVDELESAAKDQEEEASNAIAQWQETYTALEEKNNELLASVEAAQAELNDAKTKLSETEGSLLEAEGVVSEWEKRVAELETTIEDLEKQISDQDVEATAVISQWQETVTALEATNKELTEALEKATLNQESTQSELPSLLQRQLEDKENALAAALEEKGLCESRSADQAESQNAELQSLRDTIMSLEGQLTELKSTLQEANEKLADDEKVLREWESRVADQDTTINELEERLNDQENEASNAISQWQERFSELEKDNAELTRSLEDALNKSKELTDENGSLASSQAKITEAEAALAEEKANAADLKEQIAELESMINSLQQRLLDNEKESSASRGRLQQSLADSESKCAELANQLQETQDKVGSETMDQMADVDIDENEDLEATQALLQQAEDKATSLEAQVRDIEEQLKQKDEELSGAIAEWQEHCDMLDNQNKELSNELLETAQKLEEANAATVTATVWKSDDPDFEGSPAEERIEELEATIKALEEDLEESGKEAAEVVAHWQESHNALEARVEGLEAAKAALDDEVRSLREMSESQFGSQADGSDHLKQQMEHLQSQVEDLQAQLEMARTERDAAIELKNGSHELELTVESLTNDLNDSAAKLGELSQQKEKDEEKIEELSSRVEQLESQVQQLTAEQDSLLTTKLSLESDLEGYEQNAQEQEKTVDQWAGRVKELEDVVHDLEEQLEQEQNEATAVISSWEAQCNELRGSLDESQAALEKHREETLEMLKAELSFRNRLITTYDDALDPHGFGDEDRNDASTDYLNARVAERNSQLENLLARKHDDIANLFAELEQYQSQSNGDDGIVDPVKVSATEEALKAQISELQKQIADDHVSMGEFKSATEELESKLSTERESVLKLEEMRGNLEAGLQSMNASHAATEAELEELRERLSEAILAETDAKAEREKATQEQEELRDSKSSEEGEIEKLHQRIADLERAQEVAQAQLEKARADAKSELEKSMEEQEELRDSKSSEEGEVEKLQQRLADLERAHKETKAQLEKVTTENKTLQQSIEATTTSEAGQVEHFVRERVILNGEKVALQQEVERLSNLSSQLQEELEEASNTLQVLVAKEVSDKATQLATQALRKQLDEIRRQSDADRAAYLAEREKKTEAMNEVDRLRADLLALVDVTDQENEMYGRAALTMKAADMIHKKERSEIAELRNSLARALADLRDARAAEKDAEERAAKAAHHVVVCEQELASSKADMKFLAETLDEVHQSESSQRSSMEHRIHSLENDLAMLRRFHSSETDNLRNELTQLAMEKDRLMQLLKDSEKQNAAMLYAASREHPGGTDESNAAELAKLRIEKAQLLVAAAEEGARTERRLREVISTGLSSAEADMLVEKEKRLAAEAAFDNMKLVSAELQSELQALKVEFRVGRSPTKAHMEKEYNRFKAEVEQLMDENATLRNKLEAAMKSQENANYRIEKLTAEVQMAQAASNRLDREIKFHSEVQAEITRMRPSPMPKAPVEDDAARDKAEESYAELYDKVHQQALAIEKERELHRAATAENEEILALLGSMEVTQQTLKDALARAGGQAALDVALLEAKETAISLYGSFPSVGTSFDVSLDGAAE